MPVEDDTQNKIDAVRHIMATLFSAQNALRSLAPDYKWAGMSNLLGDYGEFVAVRSYGLTKASAGSDGHDALTKDGKTVQVKANHAADQIGFRGNADLILVLFVLDDGNWKEIYFGDFEKVKAESRYSKRDNKHMIAIAKFRKLALETSS